MLLTLVFSSVTSTVVTVAVMLAMLPAAVEAQVSTLRAAQIVAAGDNGKDRIRLVPGSGDEASVLVADGSGRDRMRLLIQNHPSGVAYTGIAIRLAGAMTMMRLGNVAQDPELPAPLLHSAKLLLRDGKGRDHIRLLVADDGTPGIQLLNSAGELVRMRSARPCNPDPVWRGPQGSSGPS